jgi:hypothetical protein
MSSKSKNKGKSWERDIANFLSALYDEKFVRVPHSGAYIGGANTVRKQQLDEGQIRGFKGDIIPPSAWNYFNCEAKNYADFPFHLLFSQPVPILELWIGQLLDVADPNDLNLLFIKITRKGKFTIFPQTITEFQSKNFLLYDSPKYGLWTVMDYDLFWKLNQDAVRAISINSTKK